MADADPYGYDGATDTVRVSRHDLARLLLMFRAELERGGHHRPWLHMVDYDLSFERLADAVQHADAIFYPANGVRYGGPDWRMRCKPEPAYQWPDRAPYNGADPAVVKVREIPLDGGRRRDRGTHYVTWDDHPGGRTLCGYSFAREEGQAVTGEPDCRVCLRERALAAHVGPGVTDAS